MVVFANNHFLNRLALIPLVMKYSLVQSGTGCPRASRTSLPSYRPHILAVAGSISWRQGFSTGNRRLVGCIPRQPLLARAITCQSRQRRHPRSRPARHRCHRHGRWGTARRHRMAAFTAAAHMRRRCEANGRRVKRGGPERCGTFSFRSRRMDIFASPKRRAAPDSATRSRLRRSRSGRWRRLFRSAEWPASWWQHGGESDDWRCSWVKGLKKQTCWSLIFFKYGNFEMSGLIASLKLIN